MPNTKVIDSRLEKLYAEHESAQKELQDIAKKFDECQLNIYRIRNSIKELEDLKKEIGETSSDSEGTAEEK